MIRRDLQEGEEGFEACDDGNELDTDACTNICLNASCGDGIIRTDIAEGEDGHEVCDDGNQVNEDACNACQLAVCGDGVVREDVAEGEAGFENCDDQNEVDTDACRNNCLAAVCGDGVVRTDIAQGQPGYEECDDGNQVPDDDCGNTCFPPGQGTEYRMSFPQGSVGAAQCNPWIAWRNTLNGGQVYNRIRFGREGGGEATCNGAAANQICQALRTAQTVSVQCNGVSWGVRAQCSAQAGFRAQPELHLGNGACSCTGSRALRPCIYNNNWGGFDQRICSGAAQRLYVACE